MTATASQAPWRLRALCWAAYGLPAVAVVAPRATAPVLAAVALVSLGAFIARERRLPRPFGAQDWRRGPMVALAAVLAWALVSIAWTLAPGHAAGVWAGLAGTAAAGLGLLGVVAEATREERAAVARALTIGYAIGLAFLAEERLSDTAVNYAIRDAIDRLPMGLNLMKPSAALFAMLLWPAAAHLAAWRGRAAAVALIVAASAIIVSFGGASLYLGAGAGVAAFAAASLHRGAGRALIVLLLATVLGAPFLARALPDPAGLAERFPEVPFGSFYRLYIWKFAADSALEKPVHGWGLDSARNLQQYKTDTGVFTPSRTYGRSGHVAPNQTIKAYWMGFYRDNPLPLHPHSGALQVWLELGGIGVLLAVAFLWRALAPLRAASASPYALGLLASTASVALISFGLWQGWWLSAIWLAAAFAVAASPQEDSS